MAAPHPGHPMPQALTEHLQKHGEVPAQLEEATRHCGKLEVVCRDFELQRVCYLPLSAFLLKPLQRPGHYRRLLSRLCRLHGHSDCHGESHPMGARPGGAQQG